MSTAKRSRLILIIGIVLFLGGVAAVLISKGTRSGFQRDIEAGKYPPTRSLGQTSGITPDVWHALDIVEYVGYGVGAVGLVIILVTALQRKQSNEKSAP